MVKNTQVAIDPVLRFCGGFIGGGNSSQEPILISVGYNEKKNSISEFISSGCSDEILHAVRYGPYLPKLNSHFR